MEVEDIATSFDFEKEQEIDQEEIKVALNTMKGIGKRRNWVKLVETYLDVNWLTLDFIASLRRCIKRARENQLLILEVVHHLDDEHDPEENKYTKVVDNLKKFKVAGDPCTEDFFWISNFVYRRQITFLEKLQRKKRKLDKESKQIWITLLKSDKKEIKGQKEVVSTLQVGSFIAVKDLDKVRALVERLKINIKSQMVFADFVIKKEDAVKYVIEIIKKQLSLFSKDVDDLEQMATECTISIERARAIVLRKTIMKQVG